LADASNKKSNIGLVVTFFEAQYLISLEYVCGDFSVVALKTYSAIKIVINFYLGQLTP